MMRKDNNENLFLFSIVIEIPYIPFVINILQIAKMLI